MLVAESGVAESGVAESGVVESPKRVTKRVFSLLAGLPASNRPHSRRSRHHVRLRGTRDRRATAQTALRELDKDSDSSEPYN